MLDILKERLPEGLEVIKVKHRTGASQMEILFKYDGTEQKGWLQTTCAPGYAEKNCDFTITGVMIGIGFDRNDREMIVKWKEIQDKVLNMGN